MDLWCYSVEAHDRDFAIKAIGCALPGDFDIRWQQLLSYLPLLILHVILMMTFAVLRSLCFNLHGFVLGSKS